MKPDYKILIGMWAVLQLCGVMNYQNPYLMGTADYNAYVFGYLILGAPSLVFVLWVAAIWITLRHGQRWQSKSSVLGSK
jgi:hypothetical protein